MLGRIFLRHMSSEGPMVRYGGGVVKRGTYNDFPVPQGSWQEAYNARQKKEWTMFAFGLAVFSATVAYVWKKDPFNLEYMMGPYKFMHNPPAFESPVLEPNILLEWQKQNQVVDKVTVATKK